MNRVEEELTLEGDALLRVAGNDLAIIRVIALDQFRNEQSAVDFKGELVLANAQSNVAGVTDEAGELIDTFGRDDQIDGLALGELDFEINEREPAPIGCHHRQFVILES